LISTLLVFFDADCAQAANDLPAGSAKGSLTTVTRLPNGTQL
jgi:hypothetical protein